MDSGQVVAWEVEPSVLNRGSLVEFLLHLLDLLWLQAHQVVHQGFCQSLTVVLVVFLSVVHEQVVSFELVVDSIESLDVRLAELHLRVLALLLRLARA